MRRRAASAAASFTGSDIEASVHFRSGCARSRYADGFFKVGKLLATGGAQLLQAHDIFLRLIHLPGLDVELAKIFERTLVIGIEVERLAIERVGLLVVAGLAQAEPHEVVDVGVLISREHGSELRQ